MGEARRRQTHKPPNAVALTTADLAALRCCRRWRCGRRRSGRGGADEVLVAGHCAAPHSSAVHLPRACHVGRRATNLGPLQPARKPRSCPTLTGDSLPATRSS